MPDRLRTMGGVPGARSGQGGNLAPGLRGICVLSRGST